MSAPRERGWLRIIVALLIAFAIPMVAVLRVLVPIEQSLLLIAPAMAACALLGWASGGRLWLAAIWTALAVWILATPIMGAGGFDPIARGWAMLLAASFGVVSLVAPKGTFLPRALSATLLSFAVVVMVILFGRIQPQRVTLSISSELTRRLEESDAEWQRRRIAPEWKEFVAKYPGAAAVVEQGEVQVRSIPPVSQLMFPALLALESIAALGLAWSLYHRASRTRIGEALHPLREFRFNDQLVWGLVLGVTLLVVPTLRDARGVGLNLAGFFGVLYALRGLGVLDWFLSPRGFVRLLFFIAIFLAWPVVSVFSLGLGLGDTWIDWRGRARPAA